MKHYGQLLDDADRRVKYKSADIENLFFRKQGLMQKIETIDKEIEEQEKEFLDFIKNELSAEEIEEAKEKAGKLISKK